MGNGVAYADGRRGEGDEGQTHEVMDMRIKGLISVYREAKEHKKRAMTSYSIVLMKGAEEVVESYYQDRCLAPCHLGRMESNSGAVVAIVVVAAAAGEAGADFEHAAVVALGKGGPLDSAVLSEGRCRGLWD